MAVVLDVVLLVVPFAGLFVVVFGALPIVVVSLIFNVSLSIFAHKALVTFMLPLALPALSGLIMPTVLRYSTYGL